MRTLRLISMLLMVAVMASSPVFASSVLGVGTKVEAQRFRWRGKAISVAISTSVTQPNVNIKADSDVLGAIQRSFEAWQNAADVTFQFDLSERQSISASGASGDGVSLITIAQTPDNVLLFSKDPESQSAKTRVFFNAKGAITEADIVLNPFQQFSTDGTFGTFDLQATLTHEIGHLLGLRHSGVLGSAMAESVSKNGTFGFPNFRARTLSDSDISAVRDLYGSPSQTVDCCASISGRLPEVGPGNGAFRVWAEDVRTGRVMAQTDLGADGTFKLGGLPESGYRVLYQMRGDAGATASGQIGTYELQKGEARIVPARFEPRSSDVSIDYIGINGQVADTAVPLTGGQSYVLYLGGRNLDSGSTVISFNSPYLQVLKGSLAKENFAGGASVLSLIVSVSESAPKGVYSISAHNGKGGQATLIGAVSLQ